MTADDRVARRDLQLCRDLKIGLLDLHARVARLGRPAFRGHLLAVGSTFATAVDADHTGERRDEGIDLLDDERTLAGTGYHQAAGDEQLDGVTHGVARRVVLLPELQFGPQLLAGSEAAVFDLAAQIIGDLPVHGVSHVTSWTSQPP